MLLRGKNKPPKLPKGTFAFVILMLVFAFLGAAYVRKIWEDRMQAFEGGAFQLAEAWYKHAFYDTLQAGFIVFSLLLILVLLYIALYKNQELRREQKKLLDSQAMLQESEGLFRAIFEQATIGIAIGHDQQHTISAVNNRPSVNPMFEKITGITQEELRRNGWNAIISTNDFPEISEKIARLKAREISSFELEKSYIKPDGSTVWLHGIVSALHLEGSPDFYYLCLLEDISKQKETEKALYDSERSKAVLLENLPGMAYRCNYDRDWTMQFVSAGCLALTGYPPESLLYNKEITFNELISPDYQEYLWNKWAEIIPQRARLKEEYELITASGEVKWVLEQGQGIYDENGEVIALEGLIIDITDRKEQEMKLKYLSEHYILTGLHNRLYFERFLAGELQKNEKSNRAILLINILKYSLINVIYGYHYSEQLIKKLAEGLSGLSSPTCHLFQVAIDRFAFYVKDYQDSKELSRFCEKIIEVIDNTVTTSNIKCSIGVIEIEEGYKGDAENLLKYASIAAQQAKENPHKTGYCYFDKTMEDAVIRVEDISNELAQAAKSNEEASGLYLEYQPVIHLGTNKIHGFEALARFKSPKLGYISPAEFIPIAEETQLIVPLGKKIMSMAFGFLKELEAEGYEHISMAFNVSAVQLLRDDFLPDLLEIIEKTGINPANLNIELTESVFANSYQEINEKLGKIKELGIKISLDDFGTGYSSLARERELNIDYMKVDKYFIDNLLTLDTQKAITGDIISMAHKLGHYVVAEGVEDERQKQYLLDNCCDFIQGYLFSKPLPAKLAMDLLRNS